MNCFVSAILWNVATGERLCTFQPPNEAAGGARTGIYSVTFDPEGRALAVACDVRPGEPMGTGLWDVRAGTRVQSLGESFSWITCVGFSPLGQQFATAAWGVHASAVIWNGFTGELTRLPGSEQPRAKDAGDFITSLQDALDDPSVRHLMPVRCLAFSPDGQHVLTGSDDTTAILWDAVTGDNLRKLTVPEGWSRFLKPQLAYHREVDRQLARGYIDLDENYRGKGQAASAPLPPYVNCVCFHPDGRRAVIGYQDETAVLWELGTGKRLQSYGGHGSAVECASFSSDGGQLLTGSWDGSSILWETATGKKVKTFTMDPPASSRIDLEYHTGCADPKISLRTLESESLHATIVDSVAFHPEGRLVLTSGSDRTIVVWNLATGKKSRVLRSAPASKGIRGSYHRAVLSADGRHLVSGGDDHRAILWEVDSGRQLRAFEGHGGAITSLALCPSGRRLLTGSLDGTSRLWDVATGQELARLVTFGDGKDWLVVTREGVFDGSAGGREKVTFRVGTGLRLVSVDRFFQDFYYPGLLAAIWQGERPMPKVEIGQSLPPIVRVVRPQQGKTVEVHTVSVEVEATDEGGGVRGPWLVQNGARVLVPGETRRDEKTVRRTFEVPLIEGENKLEICAASADGSWESEPAVITFRYERPLPKSELYLLAVGLNRYADESLKLRHAAPDAQAIADLFRSRGPALHSQVRIGLLVDEQATKPNILKAVQLAAQKAQTQDTLLVFLAGHGVMVDQQYYFLPHEFRRQSETFELDVRQQGLLAADLGDALAAVPALKRMVVFDTGESGGKAGLARTARDPFAFRGAIERLSRARGVFTIAAAAVSDHGQGRKRG